MPNKKTVNLSDARKRKRKIPSSYDTIYQFKVTLEYVQPTIWRRLQVPGNFTFWDLHVAIRDAIGWTRGNIHEFSIKNKNTNASYHVGFGTENRKAHDERDEMIADHLTEKQSIEYLYEVGGDWLHIVMLEKILPREKDILYPRCIAGQRACPHEGSSGACAYMDLLNVVKGPATPEKREAIERLGASFDPDDFDPVLVEFHDPEAVWSTEVEGVTAEKQN